jgi:antitoxin (DNA-binding transcriptional repressor) of toxin-antitoxin stability system
MLQTMTAMSPAEAKAHLSDVLSRVGKPHERVTRTVHGHPVSGAALPGGPRATRGDGAVLADNELMTQLAAPEGELAAGQSETQQHLHAAMRQGWTEA